MSFPRIGRSRIAITQNRAVQPAQKWAKPYIDNNILTQGADEVLYQLPDTLKGAGNMVTYSDLFTFVIMLCAVITLVVTIFRHKK